MRIGSSSFLRGPDANADPHPSHAIRLPAPGDDTNITTPALTSGSPEAGSSGGNVPRNLAEVASTGDHDDAPNQLALRRPRHPEQAMVVAPPHQLDRRALASASSARVDEDTLTSLPAGGGRWTSVEHAATFLGVAPVRLRRALDRHARRSTNDSITAYVDGISAQARARVASLARR